MPVVLRPEDSMPRPFRDFVAGTVAASLLMVATSFPVSAADDAVKAVAAAYDATGRALAAELVKSADANILLSPYSIGTAMAMALSGARGATEQDMAKVLKLTMPGPEMREANAQLIAALNGLGKAGADGNATPIKLDVANALFVAGKDNLVSRDYVALVHDKFGAEVFSGIDLAAINGWVKKKTEGKIDKLLDQVSPDAVAMLLNAVYFKAPWAAPFNKDQTEDNTFNLSADRQIKVPMMQRTGPYAVVAGDGFNAIRLPYADKSLGMIIAVPTAIDGLKSASERLDAASVTKLATVLAKDAGRQITLSLPRFKATYEADLIQAFKQMGMSLPFDPLKSDFAGITGQQNSEGVLTISQIKHKAVVEVTEEGTEAAAATSVEILARSARARPEEFAVDRPFLFFIVDDSTGTVLFEGRIVDPR
jgi:serpin B